MEIDQIISALSDRSRQRRWASELKPGSITVIAAMEKVANVFDQQFVPADFFEGPCEALYFGLFNCNEIFGTIWPTSEEIESAIVTAEVDYGAFCAVNLIGQMTNQGVHPNLDRWKLNLFNDTIPDPPNPKGRSKFALIPRDKLIIDQIKELSKVGFQPTRNSATGSRESGCDIVSAATHRSDATLGMTFSAVDRVWKKRDAVVSGNAIREFINEYNRRP